MIPTSPCLNCEDREYKCHQQCGKYIFFKIKERTQTVNSSKKKRQETKFIENDFNRHGKASRCSWEYYKRKH